MLVTVKCVTCQCFFEYEKTRGRRRKFCSSDCSRAAERSRQPAPTKAFPARADGCLSCGGSMADKPRQARYCSTRCRWDSQHRVSADKRKNELRDKGVPLIGETQACSYEPCSNSFVRTSPTGKFCSLGCRRASQRVKQPNSTPIYFKTCAECGSPVVNANKSGTPKPCADCRRELKRGRNARKNHKRRASGKPVLSTRQIAERDGTTCHLCGDAVDMSLSGRVQRGPTIDHIVPVSLGGTNDSENLALAHRDCNVKRSNRGVALLPTPA